MKLAVIGSRGFDNYELVEQVLSDYKDKVSLVISGGAIGADTLGEQWAKNNNINTVIYPADWVKYGKRAGFVRNNDIIYSCDVCVAFWDGESRGTLDSIKKAESMGKEIILIKYMEELNDN